MIEIEKESEAGKYLTWVMARDDVYKIRIAPHNNAIGEYVKVKPNELMWTKPLATKVA